MGSRSGWAVGAGEQRERVSSGSGWAAGVVRQQEWLGSGSGWVAGAGGKQQCARSGSRGIEEGSGSVKGGTPLASMAISMKDLQSVQLRKTETAPSSSKSRFGNNVSKTMSAPSSGKSIT